LLDTSFFIDAARYSFDSFVSKLVDHDVSLVTIDVVKAEFMKGSNVAQREKKTGLINRIIEGILPTNPEIHSEVIHTLISNFGEKAKGISIPDIIIGAVLQQYDSDLLLLTKNPKDFPKPLTKLETYFLMDLDQGLHTYAVLSKQ
jgi:predicted nucleic acid-binding protein